MSERQGQLLVFGTSAAVLVLEILAGRLMAPYVGVSLETFTGIIGVILAGIALGNAVGGRMADERTSEKLIGPALIIGGIASWLSLPVLRVIGPGVGRTPASIVVLAVMAFFAPAAVLSTISPMVAKLRVTDLHKTGTVIGGLSAAGTIGALFGTFVTGFVLIAAMPTRPIILGLGAVLIIAGVGLTIRLGKTRPPAAGLAAVVAVVLGISFIGSNQCQFESAYSCGRVVTDPENESLKFLILDTLRHGAIDLDDPTHLEFRYTNLIGDVIDAAPPGPLDVLHIGGGAFSLPQYVEATRPGSRSLVLEIDGVLLDVARRELGLVTSDRLEVRIGDARPAMDAVDSDAYDVVVGDAFSSLAVPWHLTTSEFVAEMDRVLREDGVYIMNVIDGTNSRFARAEAATLASHFNHVGVIVPEGGIGNRPVNQILVASDAPLRGFVIDPEHGELIGDSRLYIGDAEVLTDDFAPVEQLTQNF